MTASEECIIAQNVYALGFVSLFCVGWRPDAFNKVAALLALQPHGDYAVISVRVCMAKRAKRVAGCAAGSLVGQAITLLSLLDWQFLEKLRSKMEVLGDLPRKALP